MSVSEWTDEFGLVLGREEGEVGDKNKMEEYKAEATKYKEVFTPGPSTRKR